MYQGLYSDSIAHMEGWHEAVSEFHCGGGDKKDTLDNIDDGIDFEKEQAFADLTDGQN